MKKFIRLINMGKSYIWMILCPILTFYLFEWYTHVPLTTMRFSIQFMNIILFEFIALLLFFLFRRANTALIIESTIFCLWGIANYFIISFRSAPIMPWDIFAIKTAASVADNYQYKVDTPFVILTILFLLLIVSEFFIKFRYSKRLLWNVSIPMICILYFVSFTTILHQEENMPKLHLYDKLFTPTVMCKRDGTAIAFLMELKYLTVEKPAHYQKQKAEELLRSYDTDFDIDSVSGPNIIVIMNEAFSDPAILGDFTTNQDYMPFFHNLMNHADNTQSGYLSVSILGGNTPNTEFEFLTGNSLAFLPQGSIPYQQYVKKPITNLSSYLSKMGYTTAAMHPYYSTGWDRHLVYPLFGFEQISFLDDFKNPELIRKYVSDKSAFDKIKETFEQKEAGKPLFLFEVTMQNHSSYTDEFPNFKPDVHVQDKPSKVLDNYLSLLRLSDQSFEELIHYFEGTEENTIVVMFGDHQPTDSVVSSITKGSETDVADRYRVPVVIWSNYDIEERNDINTSANFLSVDVLKAAGIPIHGYYSYLQELQQEYPIISPIEVQKADGTVTSVKEIKEELNTYQTLQYYELMDNN